MLLCEAAGFDVILVETVGVGQNEITVRSMVDFFLLIMIAGAGDELQGMKKGVIEIADLLAVNKADGDNVHRAKLASAEYNRVLHFLQPATPGWKTRCTTCSALIPETLAALWDIDRKFRRPTRESGAFAARRKHQSIEWMHAMIEEELRHRFFRNQRVRQLLPELEKQVAGADPARRHRRAEDHGSVRKQIPLRNPGDDERLAGPLENDLPACPGHCAWQ